MLEVFPQLLARDPHGAKRVLVRIDPDDVALMNVALGQSRLDVEGGRRRQLRARAAALHLVDEIEQRRVLHPRKARIEARCRAPDGRPGPQAGRLVCGVESLREARQLRHVRQRDQVAVDSGDAVASRRVARQRHVDDGDALHPILRLHEVHAVDDRVADLAVRVPDDHDVRFGIHRGQGRRVVLRPDPGRVVARFAESAVNQDDLEVGAFTLHARERRRCGARDAAEAHARRGELRAIPQHRARRRKAGDADLHGAAGQDDRSGEERSPRRVIDVCRDVAVRGLRGGAAQEIDAEVEVVIAGCHDVVLQRIERVHDRLRLPLVVAPVVGRERIALQQIAGIDEDDAPRIAGAQRFERRRGPRQPAGRGGVTDIIPPEHAAVDVGGRNDDDVRGVGRGDCLKRDQQCGAEMHSELKIARRALVALPYVQS